VNILKANTRNVGGVAKGDMILQLPAERETRLKMEDYLKERGLEIEEVTD
jgi:D-methionine transport system ATP-binding protein